MNITPYDTVTVAGLRAMLTSQLTPAVGADETRAMVRDIIQHTTGMSALRAAIHGTQALEPETVARAQAIARRVADGEPLQYVLGHAYFAGMVLAVTPDVLIPRPETAQLVDIITDRWKGRKDLQVLDVCTGSGCIAIALAHALSYASVSATDICEKALRIARLNAENEHVSVQFAQLDALNMPDTTIKYDIIVSNPPYIAEHERKAMSPRVYDHEPSKALFVPDNDPIRFYRAISKFAATALAPEGTLYFEINPLFINQLRDMMRQSGFRRTDIERDFRGNYRFAICQL